ncbi:MAG: hypothetical protein QG671_1862 [Actinomycetota bacterium]|nr:hypothetical protein [Actinomycetota bacterium]
MNLRIAPGVRLQATKSGVRSTVGRNSAGAKRSRRVTAPRNAAPSSKLDSFQSGLEGIQAGLELAAGVMLLVDHASQRRGAKRLAADSARAAEMLTTVHLEHFPVASAPVAMVAPRRLLRLGRVNLDEQALLDADHEFEQERWQALCRHEPSEVIAAVDAALTDNASLSACIDAGKGEAGQYVTLVVHYPGPEIVTGVVQVGAKIRPRTEAEVSALYRRAVASTVIATAKEALACAPAADEAYVVVLRYDVRGFLTKGPPRLDAIYAGALNRRVLHMDWEDQDPYTVILAARAACLNVDRKGRFKPLGDQADDDLQLLVEDIAATSVEGLKDRSARRKFTRSESREKMLLQEREEFRAICVCPGCGAIAAHALREPTLGEPDWATTIRSCATCRREWAQC